MRKQVYDKAIKEGVTKERAIVLSNVFKNAYYMGCSYHVDVMKESKKYWPEEALQNPLYD